VRAADDEFVAESYNLLVICEVGLMLAFFHHPPGHLAGIHLRSCVADGPARSASLG